MAALAKRLASTLFATLMVVGVMTPAASASSHESEVLALMNAERAGNGLAPVATHADLRDDALRWSQHLVDEGSLSHNPQLAAVTTGWDRLGENVGVGPTIDALHNAFMASSGHRGNVLGDYDYVGIAVVEETPTKLWVTVVFMKSLGHEAAEEPTGGDPKPYAKQQPNPRAQQPVAALPAITPPQPTPPQPPPAVAVVPLVSAGRRVLAI